VKNYYNTLAEEIFFNLEIISSMRRQIFYINLKKSLDTDDLKKAFWINVYNAFTSSSPMISIKY
jgi:hypothetical protein